MPGSKHKASERAAHALNLFFSSMLLFSKMDIFQLYIYYISIVLISRTFIFPVWIKKHVSLSQGSLLTYIIHAVIFSLEVFCYPSVHTTMLSHYKQTKPKGSSNTPGMVVHAFHYGSEGVEACWLLELETILIYIVYISVCGLISENDKTSLQWPVGRKKNVSSYITL